MSGRKELEQNLDDKILTSLQDSPSYVLDYFYYLSNKTHTTRKVYINNLLMFINFIKESKKINTKNISCFKKIKSSDINRFLYENKEIEGARRANMYYSIKKFFKYLILESEIDLNPMDKIEAPKDNKQRDIVYLTDEEIKTIAHNIMHGRFNEELSSEELKWRHRDLAIFYMGIFTGMRVSSIVELNLEDIDFYDNRIYITEKGNKQRSIAISNSLTNILKEWVYYREEAFAQPNDPVFINRKGKRITIFGVADMLKHYTYNIDKNITPHKLRATYATRAAKKTGNVLLVAHQLGHSNLRNTMRYMGVDEEMEGQAASVMDDLV